MSSASSSVSNTAPGISANAVFQRRAKPLHKGLARRYRRTQVPHRRFSSFRHRAGSWSHQRRIYYNAELTAVGSKLRFLITNADPLSPQRLPGSGRQAGCL